MTAAPAQLETKPVRPAVKQRRGALMAHGEPMLWLSGGGLAVCLLMIVGLLVLVFWQGITTFWPAPVVAVETPTGQFMGEITRSESYNGDEAQRRLFRTGNFDLTGTHFHWINDANVEREWRPAWAMTVERLNWGRFYGFPSAFILYGEVVVDTEGLDGDALDEARTEVWARFNEHHAAARQRWRQRQHLEEHAMGRINYRVEHARLAAREAALTYGEGSAEAREAQHRFEEVKAEAQDEYDAIAEQIERINNENDRYRIRFTTLQGQTKVQPVHEIVRAYPANQLGVTGKTGVYLSRWWEFLSDDPREANSEGGVFPAIFGTVVMTMIMSLVVVPFGVLAALYLREYAKAGPVVSAVRIAVNNLAGVPSIVFGVFGLGFFCYLVGGSIDKLFFEAKLPNPTFGTGGVLWASLTLALLTLPVVIVATEEALAAVPGSMREGSYACGASKWQTIRRIVLPRAMPGIMTGTILAMARGAGEVAPLMLVGAVKLAPELPMDGNPPYVHLERSFMHLGFHIYDLGFQSQNSEAAKPMVFTTTLLLIALIAALNLSAMWLRSRLRRKFVSATF
ncbi:MAG: phosphate ABC transporter permease PstA [Phycisphaeraceae bacterium]